MPIARARPRPNKAPPSRPKLVDLGNLSTKSLNTLTPSDTESHSLKSSLTTALNELHQLDTNITLTQRKLASLSARRDRLIKLTDNYRVALAPYKRLPPELLIQIFLACLPSCVQLPPLVDEAPLLLTRICSSWRMLALNAQELWNNVQVSLSTRPIRNHHALTAFHVWLDRCPDRPLSLKIHTAPRAPFPLPGLIHPILPVNLVVPLTGRIRKLELVNVSGEQMDRLVMLPEGSFGVLEEVDVVLRDSWLYRSAHEGVGNEDGEGDDGGGGFVSTAFRGAERLRNVTLRGFDGTFNPAQLNLPWMQLRVLNLDTLPSDAVGCHEMLRLCERVEEVCVRIMRIEETTSRMMGSEVLTKKTTRLEKLRTLGVRFESGEWHDKFLEPFEVPSLRVLQTRFDWRGRRGEDYQVMDHVQVELVRDDTPSSSSSSAFTRKSDPYTDLIERSGCRIQTLHVGKNAPDYDLERLLTVAPDLREIYLADYVVVPNGVWERVGKGELGKGLERMGVSVKEVDPVLGMLEARMRMAAESEGDQEEEDGEEELGREGKVGALKEVKLGCPKLSFQQRWRMECLEKAGLRIGLCHYGFFG